MIPSLRAIVMAVAFCLSSTMAWGAAPAPAKFATILVTAGEGEVLYARHADAPRRPASLAKVMTLYLTFEALSDGRLKPTDRITVSKRAAARPPSKIGLRAGDRITVAEAMDLLVVKSANDVASALAEALAGDEAAFAVRMTRRARTLGMDHTRFRNASGLPAARQTTTARDMATLAQAVLRDFPAFYALFNQTQTTFRGRVVRGHNRLLHTPGVDGMKTGYTRAAGFNLMTSAERREQRLVAVVLGGRSSASRDAYMRRLLAAGFSVVAGRAAGGVVTVAEALGGAARPSLASRRPDEPRALVRAAASAKRAPAVGWRIQVGAFSTRARAAKFLSVLRGRHPEELGDVEPRLRRRGALHVARFAGFSLQTARRACETLRGAGQDCLVLQALAPD